MEEIRGFFAPTLAAVDKAQIGDHSSLVLLVSELSKNDQRLLEVLKRRRDDAGVSEGEGEVVESQRLGVPVTDVAHDRERRTMLFGSQLVISSTSKPRSKLIEPARLLLAVDRGRLSHKRRRGQRASGPKNG
jgi:hypothetical protein